MAMANIFKGLIKCTNCGKNYKFKRLRKQPSYICSGYANYGKGFCSGFTLKEEDLIDTVQRHLELFPKRKELSPEEYVKRIEVVGEGYKIIYKDKSESLINVENEYGMMCVKY